jgi:site-specific DNA-adenine methylase
MWSYYGSKSRVVNLYPAPKYDRIIEPFAGSARYSLKYFDRDVLLVDKYEVVIKIWKWLQLCSAEDIKRLPDPKAGEDIRKYKFECEEAQVLMRFMIGGGLAHPQWRVSPQGFGNGASNQKNNIIRDLHKIKHWKIICADYLELANEKATWFIDPPYQVGGHKYHEHAIDYAALAEWCKSRDGHVIVCENTKADWLPFYSLRINHGQYSDTTEAIWSNLPHDFMARQAPLMVP